MCHSSQTFCILAFSHKTLLIQAVCLSRKLLQFKLAGEKASIFSNGRSKSSESYNCFDERLGSRIPGIVTAEYIKRGATS